MLLWSGKFPTTMCKKANWELVTPLVGIQQPTPMVGTWKPTPTLHINSCKQIPTKVIDPNHPYPSGTKAWHHKGATLQWYTVENLTVFLICKKCIFSENPQQFFGGLWALAWGGAGKVKIPKHPRPGEWCDDEETRAYKTGCRYVLPLYTMSQGCVPVDMVSIHCSSCPHSTPLRWLATLPSGGSEWNSQPIRIQKDETAIQSEGGRGKVVFPVHLMALPSQHYSQPKDEQNNHRAMSQPVQDRMAGPMSMSRSDAVFLWHEQRVDILKTFKLRLINFADCFPANQTNKSQTVSNKVSGYRWALRELQQPKPTNTVHVICYSRVIWGQLDGFLSKHWIKQLQVDLGLDWRFVRGRDVFVQQLVPVNVTEEGMWLDVSKACLRMAPQSLRRVLGWKCNSKKRMAIVVCSIIQYGRFLLYSMGGLLFLFFLLRTEKLIGWTYCIVHYRSTLSNRRTPPIFLFFRGRGGGNCQACQVFWGS